LHKKECPMYRALFFNGIRLTMRGFEPARVRPSQTCQWHVCRP